jgi:tetratricopeptide (TPR) repeat protein
MKKLILLTIFIIAILSGCQNSIREKNQSEKELETASLDSENYDKGIKAISNGNYDEAISHFNKMNDDTSKDIVSDIKRHKLVMRYYGNAEYKKAKEEAMLIKEYYPKYDEINKLLDELPILIENEKLIKADKKFEQAKEAFSKQYYRTAYNYLRDVIKLQPEHNEALELLDTYKAKHDEEIETKNKEKEQSESENSNTLTASSNTKKAEFEKMILKALIGLASKAYFNSENDFIIEVDSSEWDRLSENEQKDILFLLGEYIDVLNEDLGNVNVSGFGAIFSEAGRQLESF